MVNRLWSGHVSVTVHCEWRNGGAGLEEEGHLLLE